MSKPATFDHLRKKQPLEVKVPIYMDQEPVTELALAQDALAEKLQELGGTTPSEDDEDILETLRADVTRWEAAVRESTLWMRFRSIGRKNYERLQSDHPPTKEQKDEAALEGGDPPAYDIDTFAPVLIAASCVEPKMTLEEVMVLFDGEMDEEGNEIAPAWNMNEILELWVAALSVNQHRRVAELGKAFG